MKRTTWGTEPKSDELSKFEKFLVELLAMTNTGIHNDLNNSKDYLDKHELQDYIHKAKGLDVTQIQKAVDDGDLTVHDVMEIGLHWGRYQVHKNWHEVMEVISKKFGIDPPEMGEGGFNSDDKSPSIQVITPDQLDKLPPEVLSVLGDALNKILDKKKGGGKK